MHGLLFVIANTDPIDPIHQLALDNLQTLHGFLTEKLAELS
jgi:hypothetical protein